MILHWHFDPVLFSAGPISVRWYGLLWLVAFLGGQYILGRMFVARGIAAARAEALLLYALLGTIIGARLMHVLAYDPAYYFAHPLEILQLWKGGLASHGGVLGMLLGLWWGSRAAEPKLDYLWLLDRVSIPSALGGALVRIANFLNSEIVGLPTHGDYGVVFESVDPLPRHPVQLYEAVGYLGVLAVLTLVYRRAGGQPRKGLLTGLFMLLVFAIRIALEFFKTPQAAYEAGNVFTVGQWLSVPFVVLGLVLIVRSRRQAGERRASGR